MADFIDKQGYTVTAISQQAALEAKPREFFRSESIYAYESLIPSTPRSATRVFFVSSYNGDEFGQFPTQAMAYEHAAFIAALTPDARKAHQQ